MIHFCQMPKEVVKCLSCSQVRKLQTKVFFPEGFMQVKTFDTSSGIFLYQLSPHSYCAIALHTDIELFITNVDDRL